MSAIARVVCSFILLLVATAAQAQNKVPSERALEALVKSSLMSFNDANVTGNYTVFHAKLSKPFRQKYSAEDLSKTFAEFRRKNIDIDIISAMKPVYEPEADVDDEGKLVVHGYFETEPSRVRFELGFIPSDGEWKLIRIDVKVGK